MRRASLAKHAPRANPVNPIPVSARNERRVTPGQGTGSSAISRGIRGVSSADRDEVVMIQEHVNQAFAPAQGRVGSGNFVIHVTRRGRFHHGRTCEPDLLTQKTQTLDAFGFRWRPRQNMFKRSCDEA